MSVYRGRLKVPRKRLGIVVSRFNEFITQRLLTSALETLESAGVREKNISVIWVPGALEVPQFCKKLAQRSFDAIIALACVLRGGTHHFECVSGEITRGISQVALETGVPIATGVITANTLEEAIERAGMKAGNKGAQAALAALEIADLNRRLQNKKHQGQRKRK
ncbi:MAG: 6,7-dimethyl-8-ribityllumazine synthase [Candidatus Omnitrophica bacterium]|nr:6,7-dimethyl-8-ribityllumazine synthase [Candidatus Omnitrophota bacterium]